MAASQNKENFLKKDDSWSREIKSFCRRILETGEDLYVGDAVKEPEWACAPAVEKGPVRSYLGFPIFWPDNTFFGTICAIDTKSTDYKVPMVALLGQLSDMISKDLKLLENYEKILTLAVKAAVDATLSEVLTLLCKAVEVTSIAGTMKCSILLLEDGKYLRHGAGPGLPDFYNEAIDGIEIGENIGSCGAAAFSKKRVIVEDIMEHPNWEPFRDLATQANIRACWSEPILSSNGEVLGTFAMYFEEPVAPNKHQIEIINSSAYNARIAIEHNRLLVDLEREKQKADMANKSKTDFLNHMSHELRTPLNAIIGFSDVIKSEIFGKLDNDKYAEYIDNINTSGTFLLELIDDILEVSKIESNKISAKPQNVPLKDIIEYCTKLLQNKAEHRKISLIVDVPEDIRDVYADVRHLKQILVNIITNAIKYTHENDTVKISASKINEMIEISIADNGPGIKDSEKEFLFTPFKQLNKDPRITQDGVGLGLSLTKGLVENNGDEIDIQSTYGKGTTATFTVPTH